MKLFDKDEGAVSIFLIIIFSALLFLAGIIVDAARIMVAENKVEIALASAARSVLADYDPQIVGEFGLFVVDADNTNEIFEKYFRANLEERHQGFRIIGYQVNEIKVEGINQGTLLNNKVFENQVLQYIKYKAPLTMANSFLETIKSGNFLEKQKLLQDGLKAMPEEETDSKEFSDPIMSGQSIADYIRLKGLLGNLACRSLTENNPVTQLISREDFLQANGSQTGQEGADGLNAWQEDALYTDMDLKKAHGLLFLMSDLTWRIARSIESLAEEGRDKLYIADYVLDKYTFVTSQTRRDHYFDKGEIEYILCGNNHELSNIKEIFSRIFFLRFSINTIDAFIRSRMPHYMLRLTDALVRGFEKGCEDVKDLYQGKGVPLCAEVGYTLKYSDYLKLLLLIQEKETQLDRMRQLIQIDIRKNSPGFGLNDKYTKLKAETSISVNLWFLPALHLDRLGFPQLKDGKYSFSRSVNIDY